MVMQPDELKRTRKSLGFSQGELAARLGISQGYVGELERGEKAIELRTANQVRHIVRLQDMLDQFGAIYQRDTERLEKLRRRDYTLRSNGEDVTDEYIARMESNLVDLDRLIRRGVEEDGLIDRRKAK